MIPCGSKNKKKNSFFFIIFKNYSNFRRKFYFPRYWNLETPRQRREQRINEGAELESQTKPKVNTTAANC